MLVVSIDIPAPFWYIIDILVMDVRDNSITGGQPLGEAIYNRWNKTKTADPVCCFVLFLPVKPGVL
jgi:hypothetical protein